jgi:predicted S18 family serine protease
MIRRCFETNVKPQGQARRFTTDPDAAQRGFGVANAGIGRFSTINHRAPPAHDESFSPAERIAKTAAEDKAAKAKEEVAAAEDKVAQAEDKVAKAKEEVAAAEDKVAQAEDKVAKAEDKVAKAEDKVAEAKVEVAAAELSGCPERIALEHAMQRMSMQRLQSAYDGLNSAQQGLTSAQQGLTSAQQGLTSAQQVLTSSRQVLTIAVEKFGSASACVPPTPSRLALFSQQLLFSLLGTFSFSVVLLSCAKSN